MPKVYGVEVDLCESTMSFYWEPDDTGEPVEVPFRWGVCERCHGSGTTIHPSMRVMTQSDFREAIDDDPDFMEHYNGGRYDVRCPECEGRRVVPECDDEKFVAFADEMAEWRSGWDREIRDEARMVYGCSDWD